MPTPGHGGFFVGVIPMAVDTTARYTERKQHDCGCITVWDNQTNSPRYRKACTVHRAYARSWRAQ